MPVALDNYSYIILDTESNTCVVVDPGDPEPVQVPYYYNFYLILGFESNKCSDQEL